MDFVSDWLSELINWGAPLIGITISFLAWRRFGSSGTLLAVAGFGLMFASPVTSVVVQQMFRRGGGLTASDVSTILLGATIVSGFGVVLLILSMRRLILAAGAAELFSDPVQDEPA